jgi:hypothetical protein
MTSEAQKRAVLKWNAKNQDYVRELNRANVSAYRERSREEINIRYMKRYYYLQECKKFRNILFEKPEKKKLTDLEKIDLL